RLPGDLVKAASADGGEDAARWLWKRTVERRVRCDDLAARVIDSREGGVAAKPGTRAEVLRGAGEREGTVIAVGELLTEGCGKLLRLAICAAPQDLLMEDRDSQQERGKENGEGEEKDGFQWRGEAHMFPHKR